MSDPGQPIDRLAAITDAEQVADIRAAADSAITAFDAWRRSSTWPGDDDPPSRRVAYFVDLVRPVVNELPADAELPAALRAVRPLIRAWPGWPKDREPEGAPSEAMERLAYIGMKRPNLIWERRRMSGVED